MVLFSSSDATWTCWFFIRAIQSRRVNQKYIQLRDSFDIIRFIFKVIEKSQRSISYRYQGCYRYAIVCRPATKSVAALLYLKEGSITLDNNLTILTIFKNAYVAVRGFSLLNLQNWSKL